jgi:hypothetical protein
MYTQKDREEYDMKLKACLKEMNGLGEKETETYIFNEYNDKRKVGICLAKEP